MRKISEILASMALCSTFYVLLSNFSAPNALCAPVSATSPPLPQPLPADIIAAWEKAGAKFGWMDINGAWDDSATGRSGDIPAFVFARLTSGVISQLPAPKLNFCLGLIGVDITDSNLNGLTKFTYLQWLDLSLSKMTDASLKQLAGLRQLQHLNLNSTNITDTDLHELAGLGQLQYLGLDSTQVTDAGLRQLTGLTQLQTLVLVGTKVTDAGVAELKKSLPNLKIIR